MREGGIRENGILAEARGEIAELLGSSLDDLLVERAVIGLFFTGIQLNDGRAGICYTPIKSIPEAVCCPSSARAMPATGRIRGARAVDLVDQMWAGSDIRKALGIAALNALSATCRAERSLSAETIETGIDALDSVSLSEEDHVVVVGALAPFLKILKGRGQSYCVLEKDASTLKPDEMPFYAPAEEARSEVPKADVLVVTGTSLIFDTLEELLAYARADATVVVVGPTSSMLAGPFFRRGVDILGGIRATHAELLLDTLTEAGSGYHIFGRSAERFVARPAGDRMPLTP